MKGKSQEFVVKSHRVIAQTDCVGLIHKPVDLPDSFVFTQSGREIGDGNAIG